MNPLTTQVEPLLIAAGIGDARVIHEEYAPEFMGAATSILERGELRLKFYSDKGEVFLDISPADMPERCEKYQDIAVAFGWKGKEEVARMTSPEPIESVIANVGEHWRELENGLSSSEEMRTRIRAVAQQRNKEFMERLYRLATEAGTKPGTSSSRSK